MSTQRCQEPKWTANMALSLDYNYAMTGFVGAQGLNEAELEKYPIS